MQSAAGGPGKKISETGMPNGIRGFVRLLRTRPEFRRIWTCHCVSLLGDWLSYIAVSIISIEQGEGALAIALVLVAHTLPAGLIAPISGPLADRFDRRTLIIISYLGAFALTLGMWGAASAGHVYLLQGLLLARGLVSGLGITARTSSIPMVVEEDELYVANALLGLTWSLLFTLGVALGGVATAVFSPNGAILLDAGTFMLAAFIAIGLPKLKPQPVSGPLPRPGLGGMLTAWRFAQPNPEILTTLLAKTPQSMSNAAGWIALNLLAGSRLSTMELSLGIGLMQAVRAIGTGLGPLVPSHWYPLRSNLGTPFAFVGVCLFCLSENPWFFLPGLLLWGMGGGHNWVSSTAELQKATPNHLLGRMVALDFMLFCLSSSIIGVLVGLTIDATQMVTETVMAAVSVAGLLWLSVMVLRHRHRTSQ
mgnify:CR=1 FL=1